MKFYATTPSRARLEEDVLTFVSLLRAQRDEQAEKIVLSTAGPAAASLHKALQSQGLLAGLEDPSVEGAWRDKIEDPHDPYGPDGARVVEFAPGKGALRPVYKVWFGGAPTQVTGRFSVEPRGAGFTLGFAGFDAATPSAAAEVPSTEEPTVRKRAPARRRTP